MVLTKKAHWNIKSPKFIAPHKMIARFPNEIATKVARGPSHFEEHHFRRQ